MKILTRGIYAWFGGVINAEKPGKITQESMREEYAIAEAGGSSKVSRTSRNGGGDMNTSSFSTQAYVLLAPKLNIIDGEQVCTLSFSYQDDPLGDEKRWVHSMLRCHKATATYACNNIKRGDLIFISGARYHTDETGEDIKGNTITKHYFSRGSISKLLSAEDICILKNLKTEIGKTEAAPETDKPSDKEPLMSNEEWEEFIDNDKAKEELKDSEQDLPF